MISNAESRLHNLPVHVRPTVRHSERAKNGRISKLSPNADRILELVRAEDKTPDGPGRRTTSGSRCRSRAVGHREHSRMARK